jgi:hypothetical protein
MFLHTNTLLQFILSEAASDFVMSMILYYQLKHVILHSNYFLASSPKIIDRSSKDKNSPFESELSKNCYILRLARPQSFPSQSFPKLLFTCSSEAPTFSGTIG